MMGSIPPFSAKKTEIGVEKIVSSVMSSYEDDIKKKKISLNINIAKKIRMNADEYRIKTAIINLIDNALTYSNEGGEIEITASQKNNNFYFEIKDQGIGIPKKDQMHVFEKFFRAKNAFWFLKIRYLTRRTHIAIN